MSYADLKDLDELRRSGAITEEEYQKEKEKVLNGRNVQSGSSPFFGMPENSYLALMHVSQFSGYIIPFLGFIVPVVLWLMNRENSAKVDTNGKDIINFMLSWIIYALISGLLCIILIGIPILIALVVMEFIFIIMATIKANNGESWKYPMTITFLR